MEARLRLSKILFGSIRDISLHNATKFQHMIRCDGFAISDLPLNDHGAVADALQLDELWPNLGVMRKFKFQIQNGD